MIDSGFFGRILSVRGEFGYWVFEGDWQPAQRPSWNYRTEDGGGIVSDMFCALELRDREPLRPNRERVLQCRDPHPERWDEDGQRYDATADDAAYGIFQLEGGAIVQLDSSWAVRVHRKELVEFQVDGTLGVRCRRPLRLRDPAAERDPKPVWNPDLAETHDYLADWIEAPTNEVFENGFKLQWEQFLRHVLEDAPYEYDLLAGARGVRLSEEGLRSSAEGRRIELAP